jgi:hypothetical protein
MQAIGQQQTSTALRVSVGPKAMLVSPSRIVIPAGSKEGVIPVRYKIRTSSTGGSGTLALRFLDSNEQNAVSYTSLGAGAGTPVSEQATMKATLTPVVTFGSDNHSNDAGDIVNVSWQSDELLSHDVIVEFLISAN